MNQTDHLYFILIVLAAAIAFVLIVQRLRISPVLGYLAAGMVIGPFGGKWVQDDAVIHTLGEFGVIFLLFSIGLELPFQRLLSMRWYIFGLGLAQVSLTSLAIGSIAYMLGAPAEAALVIGGALALSSTATVLQLLKEREEVAAKFGRVAVAVLIFQDLAVVPLLVLIPLLAIPELNTSTALALAALKGGGALIVIILMGRYIFRPLYTMMATIRNTEIFTATTLFIILCASLITAKGGMTMALGAFLAGMLLAETQYRHQIEADIHPFRGLFLGLFFMTVGMSINTDIVSHNMAWVAIITAGLLLVKMVVLTILSRIAKLTFGTATHVGMILSQGSEFGFVILGLSTRLHIIPDTIANILAVSIAITLLVTPLLAIVGNYLSHVIDDKKSLNPNHIAHESDDLSDHVIIAGFGRVGQIISRLLSAYRIPYIVLDNDIHCVQEGSKQNLPVYFGDARRLDTFLAAGIERACAVIVALNHERDTERTVALVHEHYPDIEILVRSHDHRHKKMLENMGATTVIPEVIEPSLQLGAVMLERIGIPPEEIDRTLALYRKDNYAFLDSFPANTGG